MIVNLYKLYEKLGKCRMMYKKLGEEGIKTKDKEVINKCKDNCKG